MVFVIVFVVDVVRLRMCDGFVFVVVPLFSAVCNLGVVIEAYMCVVYFLFSRTSFPSSTSAYTSPSPFSHHPPTPPPPAAPIPYFVNHRIPSTLSDLSQRAHLNPLVWLPVNAQIVHNHMLCCHINVIVFFGACIRHSFGM